MKAARKKCVFAYSPYDTYAILSSLPGVEKAQHGLSVVPDNNDTPLNVSQRCELRCAEQWEEIKHTEMYSNHTTPHISPPNPKPGFPGYYALITFVLLTLIGCVAALVVYLRRRSRFDELRHRLIPLYSYDPTEERDEWEDSGREEEELTEPLYKEGKLSFSSTYGS